MIDNRIYEVRHPSLLIVDLISLSLLTAIILMNSLILSNLKFLSYIGYGLLIACVILLAITVFRTSKKPFEVQLSPELFIINGTTIEAKDINQIFIKGYFKPVIGIKPRSNIFVPYKFCFRFLEEQEDQGMKEITSWAEQNQIKVSYKRFFIK